jgi:outer membrane lipoprotein-sorting protein
MFKFILSPLILTTFLIFSCAPKPRILPEKRTPQNVLKCAVGNQIKFETFACIVNLKLKGEKAKFSSTVEFFYRSPDLFAFYPRSFWGTDIFKAKGEKDSLTIYFPNDNEFYRGDFSDFEKSELWSSKIDFKTVLEIITGENNLNEKDVLYMGQEKNHFIYKFEDERWIKQYSIDFRKCRLIRSIWADKKRGEVYEIEYKSFVTFQDVELAKIIEIKSSTKESVYGESAKIKFIERKFDISIPEKKFQFEIPPDAKRVTFEPKPN